MNFNKQILIRVTEDTCQQIEQVLETYSRKDYPTKADLIRQAIALGLQQLNKDNKF